MTISADRMIATNPTRIRCDNCMTGYLTLQTTRERHGTAFRNGSAGPFPFLGNLLLDIPIFPILLYHSQPAEPGPFYSRLLHLWEVRMSKHFKDGLGLTATLGGYTWMFAHGTFFFFFFFQTSSRRSCRDGLVPFLQALLLSATLTGSVGGGDSGAFYASGMFVMFLTRGGAV
ncbi:hypothetical protein IWX49DRAFT_428442 [Phyllosticta citricarpa]